MSDLFGVEVPEVTGLHNLLTLACETASLVGDTGLFPKLRALLTMAAWNKDRSEGLERGEIERMMYYAKPEETDVTGDVEAFLTKNDADGNELSADERHASEAVAPVSYTHLTLPTKRIV